jgi:hypothetical protein
LKEGKYMNLFQTQTTNSKLEQLRHDAELQNALKPIRQQHWDKLKNAFKTMLEELRVLTIGSLETAQKVQA